MPREQYGYPNIPDDLQRIMRLFLTGNDLAVSTVIGALDLSRSTATRRLAELVKMELIEAHGAGKGTRYRKVNKD